MATLLRGGGLLFGTLLGVGLVTGCTHPTAQVFVQPNAMAPVASGAVPGIPFYTRYGVCKQETVWEEPRYTLALTVITDGKDVLTRTMQLNETAFSTSVSGTLLDGQALVTDLQAAVGVHELKPGETKECPYEVAQYWNAIAGHDAFRPLQIAETRDGIEQAEREGRLQRVLNTAKVDAAVDYSTVYYLNTRSPLIGTATVDAKIGADGTLTEGSVTRDDQTWATVATDLTSIATTVAPILAPAMALGPAPPTVGCAARGGWPGATKTVEYRFTVKKTVLKHDHQVETPMRGAAVCTAADGSGVTGGSFQLTKLEDAPAAAVEAPKKPDAAPPAPAKP